MKTFSGFVIATDLISGDLPNIIKNRLWGAGSGRLKMLINSLPGFA